MHGIDPSLKDNNPTCTEKKCKFSEWEIMEGGAYIVCVNCMAKIKSQSNLTYALTSGGLDPIHSGHLSSFVDSAKQANLLIVVVNDDQFLINKKGKAFLPQKVRCQIVSMLRKVDFVVPAKPSRLHDPSVSEMLEIIKPDFFTKGGDRNIDNIPEKKMCQDLGIKIVQGMGDDKHWSSSKFLEEWFNFRLIQTLGDETRQRED